MNNFKNFVIVLKHDNGIIKLKTSAKDKRTAINNILKAENCPQSAIKNVYEI